MTIGEIMSNDNMLNAKTHLSEVGFVCCPLTDIRDEEDRGKRPRLSTPGYWW